MKILLTGSTGKLGQQIKRLNILHKIYAPTRKEMDITNKQQVYATINSFKPNCIIHCAALTNVVQCEQMQNYTWQVNVKGTANLLDTGCFPYFIYVSSACVFKGDRGNYCELDTPYPTNFYGLTKLVSESIVRYSGLAKWLIVRTNFVERGKWPYPKAFTDRYGTWLYTDQVAEAILELTTLKVTGIKHVCAKKKRSMYELALEDPANKHVKPYTLQEHYETTPTPKLTKDMSLISVIKKKGCCG